MATSETLSVPHRGARRRVRRTGHAWITWAAVVAVSWLLAQRIGGAAEPVWAEEVALVVVIGVATVSAPPVWGRLIRPPADPKPFFQGHGESVVPVRR